jgi:hypothetical protein
MSANSFARRGFVDEKSMHTSGLVTPASAMSAWAPSMSTSA